MLRVALLGCALLTGCADATCQEACDQLYACLTDTSTPKAECVKKCSEDSGKGSATNRNCIAGASCDDLKHGGCPDLIVR